MAGDDVQSKDKQTESQVITPKNGGNGGGGGNKSTVQPKTGDSSKKGVNEVDLNTIPGRFEGDELLLSRFEALKDRSAKELSSTSISNWGLETGRPPLKLADSLKGDATNIYSRPSMDALFSRIQRPESLRLATAEEMAKISTKLEALGVPKEHLTSALWDVCVYCTGVSSSPHANPKGVIDFGTTAITRDAVFAVIKEHSTLRAVCRLFAPLTWQYMKLTNQPPPDWFAKGFSDDTKFAAFDAFDAVENPAAVQPLEGVLIKPTEAERIANATHKRLALNRNAGNKRFANFDAEITGGMFGCDKKLNWRESKCG